jgi:hypothetical protein
LVKVRDVTKSSDEGHIFVPHLVEVRDVTKPSNKGHIFVPHLVKVRDVTKSSDEGHIFFRPYLVDVRDVTFLPTAWQELSNEELLPFNVSTTFFTFLFNWFLIW